MIECWRCVVGGFAVLAALALILGLAVRRLLGANKGQPAQ